MSENSTAQTGGRATIMLCSGEYDKALTAFEIATGMAAMGTRVDMWFIMYGVNCLMKPRGLLSSRKWRKSTHSAGTGRIPETDNVYQDVLRVLNRDGASNMPLSQLDFLGAGRWIMNRILKRKNIAGLETLIDSATRLGVHYKICQPCVDIMALDVLEDLIVEAEVLGVSTYVLDTRASYYNVVI